MKRASALFAVPLLWTLAGAQPSPAQSSQPAPPSARTDIYHVHFTKAALGKAAQLGDYVRRPDPQAPMPGHYLVLRHQNGAEWDYAVIQHLGAKSATITAAGRPLPPSARDLSEWHTDTFVSGPPWAEFARAMAIEGQSAEKSSTNVYTISVYRAAAGHRDQLEKLLVDSRRQGGAAGNVLMQHLEGGPWQYIGLARFNSWQDFANNQTKSQAQTAKGGGDWFEVRGHATFHNDTIADRIAP